MVIYYVEHAYEHHYHIRNLADGFGSILYRVDCHNHVGAERLGLPYGNAAEHAAVNKQHTFVLHGSEHRGDTCGGLDALCKTALFKYVQLLRIEVYRRAGKRNVQIFKPYVAQVFNEQLLQFFAAKNRKPGKRKGVYIDNVGSFELQNNVAYVIYGNARRIATADYGAHRGARYAVGLYAFLFERLQKADVNNPSRSSAAKGKSQFFTHKFSVLIIVFKYNDKVCKCMRAHGAHGKVRGTQKMRGRAERFGKKKG